MVICLLIHVCAGEYHVFSKQEARNDLFDEFLLTWKYIQHPPLSITVLSLLSLLSKLSFF
jgi:hypothetical protein